MSNLYPLTAKIHELLPQVKAKYGLEFKIKSDFAWFYSKSKKEYKTLHKQYGVAVIVSNYDDVELKCLDIQAPQLRQILVGLSEVLGIYTIHSLLDKWLNYKVWNDDVDTLFNREPLPVLQEVKELLLNLLK